MKHYSEPVQVGERWIISVTDDEDPDEDCEFGYSTLAMAQEAYDTLTRQADALG